MASYQNHNDIFVKTRASFRMEYVYSRHCNAAKVWSHAAGPRAV